jgi:hypothetical protein
MMNENVLAHKKKKESDIVKRIDLLAIPVFNLSAVFAFYAMPGFDIIESLLKIAVLIATLIFTVVRIKQIVNNKNKGGQ